MRLSQGSGPWQKPAMHTQSVLKPVTFAGQGKNGLWVTVERNPAKVGGLGEVSKTIPWALNHYLKKDVRILMPLLEPLKAEGGFTDTGITKTLTGPDQQIETFRLLEKYEKDSQTWVYAIENDKYFGRFKHLYFPKNQDNQGLGSDAIFRAIAMFNRAAAEFAPELSDKTAQTSSGRFHPFRGNVDFVMVHDWLTGFFLNQLPKGFSPAKLFMLHNTYDEGRSPEVARTNHLEAVPPALKGRYVSPLSLGIGLSDVVIANANYVRSITNTALCKGADFIKHLKDKLLQGRVFDMHHGLSEEYNPYNNPALQSDGFTELRRVFGKKAQRRELMRYKTTNKVALQKAMGLNPDPQATVFLWLGRFEPYQKGFFMVMNEAQAFLRRHPKAQLILGGQGNHPKIQQFVDTMAQTDEFKGRLIVASKFFTKAQAVQMNAGADFMLMPSLYEPYGLTQLEGMRLGCIPIAHNVDGIRSTISDPVLDRLDDGPEERVWAYGQNGIKMASIDVPRYRKAISKWSDGKPMSALDRHVIHQAQSQFSMALERAWQLKNSQPDTVADVALNGIRYVQREHNWKRIVERYDAAIDRAVEENQRAMKTPSAS